MPLQLESLSHRFGSWQALDGVSLSVDDGDCYGFLGHNGAGKTTSMRIALGLMRPTSGQILIDGFDVARHPREARARMGGLIEVPGFHGSWDGRRNLVALARLQGFKKSPARDEALRQLERVGLADVGSKPVRAYSHGMRQRLGIAQALLGSPRYVLLDEPTNGLDPEGIAEMRSLLLRLRSEEGLTVLISSHQLAELNGLCNRVGVIKKGRLLVEGRVTDLLRSDSTRFRLLCSEEATPEQTLEDSGISFSQPDDGLWILDLADRDPAVVLRELVVAGAGVSSFAPEEPTLEEFYLRHTRGDGSVEDSAPPQSQARAGAVTDAPAQRIAPSMPLLRLLRYDLVRWLPQISVWLVLLCPAVLGALKVLDRHNLSRASKEEIEAGTLQTTADVTAFEGLGFALAAGLPLLSFLALGFASQALAGERGQGTLRNVLLRPVRRVQVAAGKAISVLLATFLSYALLLGAGFAMAAWLFEFRGLTEVLPNGEVYVYPEFTAERLWGEIPRLLCASLLPLAAMTGIGFLAGAIVRHAATGLALALILGAFLEMLRLVARGFNLEHWLPPAYLPSFLSDKTSYVYYYLDSVTGVGNAFFPFEDTVFTHPAIWVCVTFALATIVVIRRSVP